MPKWKDTTSYSRDAKERIPTTWEITVPGVRILVHRWMGDDGWYGTCRELGEDKRRLTAPFLEEAQTEFLEYLAKKAQQIFTQVCKVIDS
jgi:hypothetical protein